MEEVSPLPNDVLELGRHLIPSPVFLVGCARSGTSIFGEALAAHPSVAYLFELSSLWNAAVPARVDHRLERHHATAVIAERIYRSLHEVLGARASAVVVEKNPKHVLRVAFLDQLFPHAKFLHIIRDGRDVVASLMFRNRGDRWGHLEIPGWQDLLDRYTDENHVRCAHQWRDAVVIARAEGAELGDRYLEIRYEDLVLDARVVVGRALEHIGLGLVPGVESFLAKIQNETAGSYHAKKQVRHFVENHRRRIGRFEENLSRRELDEVVGVCGDLLRELGYA
jgi:hypothetical protein